MTLMDESTKSPSILVAREQYWSGDVAGACRHRLTMIVFGIDSVMCRVDRSVSSSSPTKDMKNSPFMITSFIIKLPQFLNKREFKIPNIYVVWTFKQYSSVPNIFTNGQLPCPQSWVMYYVHDIVRRYSELTSQNRT